MDRERIVELARRALDMEEEMFQELSAVIDKELTDEGVPKKEADRIRAVLQAMYEDTGRHAELDKCLIASFETGGARQ